MGGSWSGSAESWTDRARRSVANRTGYLVALRDEPMPKPELCTRLDAPRSTVDRAVRELEAVDFVERRGSAYHVTTAGRLALDRYHRYVQWLDALAAASRLLRTMPDGAAPDGVVLAGATVRWPDRTAPELPTVELVDRLADATRLYAVLTAVRHVVVDYVRRHVVDGEVRAEVVLDPGVLASLRSAYPEVLETIRHAEAISPYCASSEIPYGLVVAESGGERWMAVVASTDDGRVGTITNDRRGAVEWAERRYADLVTAATPIPPDGAT